MYGKLHTYGKLKRQIGSWKYIQVFVGLPEMPRMEDMPCHIVPIRTPDAVSSRLGVQGKHRSTRY